MEPYERLVTLRSRKERFKALYKAFDYVQDYEEEAFAAFLLLLQRPGQYLLGAHSSVLVANGLIMGTAGTWHIEDEIRDLFYLFMALQQGGGRTWEDDFVLNALLNLFCMGHSEYLEFLACYADPTLPTPLSLEHSVLILERTAAGLQFRPNLKPVMEQLKVLKNAP